MANNKQGEKVEQSQTFFDLKINTKPFLDILKILNIIIIIAAFLWNVFVKKIGEEKRRIHEMERGRKVVRTVLGSCSEAESNEPVKEEPFAEIMGNGGR